MTGIVSSSASIGFLGPSGTFTEEALRSEPGLAGARLVALPTFVAVFEEVASGGVDYGFVPIENSIEGSVSITTDQLVFERELIIVGETVLPVTQNLLAPPGVKLEHISRVISFPVATAQCRAWLSANLPGVEEVAATSTAAAVRQVATEAEAASGPRGASAAIGTALAGSLYGLDLLAAGVEDNPDNTTRFVLVTRHGEGVPAPSGHDKTSVVCFQSSDHPGSLHGILGQFSARDLNLVKLESRPTKKGLGEYCFLIDFEGHVGDEIVADCLRDLHASLRSLKFLGSYPAAGFHADGIRRAARQAWAEADIWIDGIRSLIVPARAANDPREGNP
jgi:prephenate dehydratase